MSELFFAVHRDLPCEGPGSDASTLRALATLRQLLPDAPRVVDVGCGPGRQTLALAEALPKASITAFDLHEPFLDQLRAAASSDVADRIRVERGDMTTWTPSGPVDLVWCEGAAYIMGVEAALARWSSWLTPGGCIAFSDAVWLTEGRSPAAVAMWEEYADMGDADRLRERVRAAGFEPVADFTQPPGDWSTYYEPMRARIATLQAQHAGDPAALAELALHRHEIEVYDAHGAEYSYQFVTARRR